MISFGKLFFDPIINDGVTTVDPMPGCEPRPGFVGEH
jgi:hypothetical protein